MISIYVSCRLLPRFEPQGRLMSVIKQEDNQKWINSVIAIFSILIAFIVIRFSETMGEWFDLEAKIPSFGLVAQGVGIVLGLACFVLIIKNKSAYTHLKEVYGELTKVIWPDKDSILKITIGLVISLSIVSGFFVMVDYIFRWILNLLY